MLLETVGALCLLIVAVAADLMPCNKGTGIVDLTDYRSSVDGTVDIQHCHWATFSSSINFKLSVWTHVRFSDVQVTGAGTSVVFTSSTSTGAFPTGSTIELNEVRVTRGSSAFCVQAQSVKNLRLTVRNSSIGAGYCALCVSTDDPDGVFIEVKDSIVHTQSAGSTRAVSVGFAAAPPSTYRLNNITMIVTRSSVLADSNSGDATAVGVGFKVSKPTSLVVDEFAVSAVDSSVVALSTTSAAALGIALLHDTDAVSVSVTGASITAVNCTVRSEGTRAVAAVGIASIGKPNELNAVEVTLTCVNCTVSSTSEKSAASAGFAVFSEGKSINSNLRHVGVYVLNSTVTSHSTSASSASIGLASCGSLTNGQTTVEDAAFYAVGSTVWAKTGLFSSASVGIATTNSQEVTMTISHAVFFGSQSVVIAELTSSGGDSAAAVALAQTTGVSSTMITATNVSMYCIACTVRSVAPYVTAASLGIASHGSSSELDVTLLIVYGESSTVTSTSSSYNSASLGIATHGASRITLRSVFLYGIDCECTAVASNACASLGVSTPSVASVTTQVTISTLVIFANGTYSSATTSDGPSAASAGVVVRSGGITVIASDIIMLAESSTLRSLTSSTYNAATSFGLVFCASKTTNARVINIILYAVDSDIRARTGGAGSAVLGIAIRDQHTLPLVDNTILSATNGTFFAERCRLIASSGFFGVAVAGISAYGERRIAHVTASDLAIFSIDSTMTASSTCASAAGICVLSRDQTATLRIRQNLTLFASNSSLSSTGVSATALGVFANTIDATAGTINIFSCFTEISSFYAVGAKSLTTPVSYAGRIVLLGGSVNANWCVNLRPLVENYSLFADTSVACINRGWAPMLGIYYVRNLAVASCNAACLDATFPGKQSINDVELFDAPCSSFCALPSNLNIPHISAPAAPVFTQQIEQLPQPSTASLTLPESTRSTTPSPTSSLARSATTTQIWSQSTSPSPSMTTASTSRVQSATMTYAHSFTLTIAPSSTQTRPEMDVVTTLPASSAGNTSRESKNPVAAVLSVAISEDAAEAVATAGSVSTIGSGLATPSAATQYARVAAVLRSVLCIIAEDDDSPNFLEHPLQFPFGGGKHQHYAGACLSDVLLLLVVHALQWILWKCMNKNSIGKFALTVVSVVGIAAPVLAAYFLPNAMGVASILLFSQGHNGVELFVAIFTLCCWFGLLAWPALTTLRLASYVKWTVCVEQGKRDVSYECYSDSSLLLECFSKYFDDGREPGSLLCRIVYFEEVATASLTAFLAGMRPSSEKCIVVLVGILIVSVLHFGYAAIVRPFNRRLATIFSLASAGVVVAICVIGIFVLYDDEKQSLLVYPLLLQNCIFFLQLAAEAVWAYVVASRRGVRRRQAEATQALLEGDADDDSMEMPIKVAPVQINPLASVGGGSTS